MGRQPRWVADGLVYHALNRGNNRACVFACAADFQQFLDALDRTKKRYPFHLYAYCLMSNHFHLVLEPAPGQNISRILQSLTITHTWHFHKQTGTSGHVWQGRFKSPVIATDEHLLTVMRYVESNPLRAGLVSDLADYPWSSYHHHALGESLPMLEESPVWALLGKAEPLRRAHWKKWLHTPLTEKELEAVRRSVSTGRPYGEDQWVAETAAQLGFTLGTRRRGRPRKAP